MRLTRRHVEAMAEAIQDTAAEEFVLDVHSDGKLAFSAVEVVEKVRPLSLTKASAELARRNGRTRERVTA